MRARHFLSRRISARLCLDSFREVGWFDRHCEGCSFRSKGEGCSRVTGQGLGTLCAGNPMGGFDRSFYQCRNRICGCDRLVDVWHPGFQSIGTAESNRGLSPAEWWALANHREMALCVMCLRGTDGLRRKTLSTKSRGWPSRGEVWRFTNYCFSPRGNGRMATYSVLFCVAGLVVLPFAIFPWSTYGVILCFGLIVYPVIGAVIAFRYWRQSSP